MKNAPNFSSLHRWLAAGSLFLALPLLAGIREIASPVLSVKVDTAFPRVIEYRWKSSGAMLPGQPDALQIVAVNGTNYTPRVKFSQSGRSAATYTLDFPELR